RRCAARERVWQAPWSLPQATGSQREGPGGRVRPVSRSYAWIDSLVAQRSARNGSSVKLVGAGSELGGPAPVGAPRPRPLVRVVAVFVHVPVGASGVPHAGAERVAQLPVKARSRVAADLDRSRAGALERVGRLDHVLDPRLVCLNPRTCAAVCVGAEEEEEVRKSGAAHAEVRARELRPLLRQAAPAG